MNLVELAQRIKSRRLDQRLTIEEVAAQAGLTQSWLSKVENFRVTPSLPALGKIAKVLDVSISELLEGLDEKPQLVVIRKDERKIVQRDQSPKNKSVYESLAHRRLNRAMDPFLITIPGCGSREEALPHEGEEFSLCSIRFGPVRIRRGNRFIEGRRQSLFRSGCPPSIDQSQSTSM